MRYQSNDINFAKCGKVVLPSTGVEVYKTGTHSVPFAFGKKERFIAFG